METKAIFNSFIAKQLIRSGNRVVDIQPDKTRENAVIFYFEVNEKFLSDLIKVSHNK